MKKYPFPSHSWKLQHGGICPHRLYFNFNNIWKRNKCLAGFFRGTLIAVGLALTTAVTSKTGLPSNGGPGLVPLEAETPDFCGWP